MKRTLLAIVAAFMMIASVNAQRLVDIQTEARFITDKMVVELGLSNVQRNNILNINLTYLDGIRSYRDIDSHGWKYRNKQLKHILSDKQWKKYKESYYFYRPISWRNNAYIHNIYAKYPKHNWKSDKHHHHHKGDFGRPCKSHKYDKHYKKHYKKYKKAKREFGNNSPEAIRMRHEMRKDAMRGAR